MKRRSEDGSFATSMQQQQQLLQSAAGARAAAAAEAASDGGALDASSGVGGDSAEEAAAGGVSSDVGAGGGGRVGGKKLKARVVEFSPGTFIWLRDRGGPKPEMFKIRFAKDVSLKFSLPWSPTILGDQALMRL